VRTFLICIGSLLLASPLHAQARRWNVTIEGGEMRFGGTSADTSFDATGAFRPSRPATLGLRLERGTGAVRLGVGLLYGAGPAALIGPDVSVAAVGDPLRLLELAPTVSWRISRMGAASLWAGAGPIVDRWSWSAAATRLRVGGEVAGRLEAPLGNTTALTVRLGLARTPSILEDDDLPPTFERRASWRSSIALGLALNR
jgi:hypothetical protein